MRLLCFLINVTAVLNLAHADATYNLPPTNYATAEENNTISRLQDAIDEQKRTIPGASPNEILKALLDELEIPVSSQTLVFSKTSLQRDLITPKNPRALYFNSDFYVGFVPGGKIEVIAADDPTGMMFYSFDLSTPPEKRRFVRDRECLTCHSSARTKDIPGLLVRSVFPDEEGQPVLSWGDFTTTPASPITERWGGWYVTGLSDPSGHMGNKWLSRGRGLNLRQHINKENLSPYIDTSKYLTDTSDILALMLLEHQTEVHNVLSAAKINYLHRLYLAKAIDPTTTPTSPKLQKIIHGHAIEILKSLLFANEFRLPGDGISGSERFANEFTAKAKSHNGWSLRDLRLQKRIFKYRCSYMIHSHAFETLPEPIKSRTLSILHQILTEERQHEALPTLSDREKRRIHEILTHTHPAYRKVAQR